MDNILHATKNTFTFLDDILIVTKGTHEAHMQKVEEAIRVLDKAGVRLKIEKCKLAQKETEWLGYKVSAAGIRPIEEKIQAITDRLRPKNLKDLRSFMGAINQMNRFIPSLPHLLRKDAEWKWRTEHENAFSQIEEAIKEITAIKHFQRDAPTRIICDACKEGLGAVFVTTPVRVVVLYTSEYFCCFFEGHSSFLASLVEKSFGFINFELKFAEQLF